MSNTPYQEKDFENAKRYYSEKADFKYVGNKLSDDGVPETEIDAIILEIRRALSGDINRTAKQKLLIGFLIVVGSGALIIVSSGTWFRSQVVGFIGIFLMVYGFIKIGSGLKIILGIEDSSFFRQFEVFSMKKKKSGSKKANIPEKRPLKQS